jgi:4-amino-4-deoxy-L-arabinose transferase-like glycosyltransferase
VAAGDAYFSEWAMRLPAWLAALGAVFSVAWLGAVLGWRRAGWVAAALLVVHPGFVRYAAEARGYAFLLALTPLLLGALARGVQTGRWRWWALAAVLDWALLYTWPLSLHVVAVANLGAFAALAFGRGRPLRDRVTLMLRWALTALVAAAVWLQLFLPNVIQLRFWLKGASAKGVPGDGGWVDALAAMLTGRVWHDGEVGNPLLTPWARTWQDNPWWVVLAGAFALGLLAFGAAAAWRRTPAWRPWLPAVVVPPVLVLVQAGLSGSVLYPWYLIFAVPGVLLLMAIGLETAATKVTAAPASEIALLGAGVLGFALMGSATRSNLRHHPIEPNREAALLVQPVVNPHHPDYQRTVLTAGFLMRNTIYDPGVREFATVAEMRALMEEARQSGRDFAVIYGQRELARISFPEIMAVLEDPAVFEPVATLYGQEGYSTRHILRHSAAR